MSKYESEKHDRTGGDGLKIGQSKSFNEFDSNEDWEETARKASKFYELKLDSSRIHLIDTRAHLNTFLDKIDELATLNGGRVYVGMDSEWKPTCMNGVVLHHSSGSASAGAGCESSSRVALMQVATHTDVYLIDAVSLLYSGDEVASALSKRFFTNKKVVKIGYGFSHDIRMILASIGYLHDADAFRHTVIDLAFLVDQVFKTTLLYNAILSKTIEQTA